MPRHLTLNDLVEQIYDPTGTNLTSTNGQAAITELDQNKVENVDSTFNTHTKYPTAPSIPINAGGTTNIDFTSGNIQQLTGAGGTTIGAITFPGVGTFALFIPDSVAITSIDPTNKQEYGGSIYGFPGGQTHIMVFTHFGDGVARWSAVGEAS